MAPEELWIFGYGSLIWKHDDIPHTESEVSFIEGYKRRAWQGSTDHRGTPEAPGRVVSVYSRADFSSMGVHEKDEEQFDPKIEDPWRVYGIAFKVTEVERERIMESLAFREKDGYQPVWLPLFAHEPGTSSRRIFKNRALTYIAPPLNPSFLGFETHQHIAMHIATAKGPSGPNIDYHTNLRDALERMGHPDHHISSIVDFAFSLT